MSTPVMFTPLPIVGTIACCIPVTPDGEWDAPMEQRSDLCAIDANWLVGAVPVCDIHAKLTCDVADIDWTDLLIEAGRDFGLANRPPSQRERHDQAKARADHAHFVGADE